MFECHENHQRIKDDQTGDGFERAVDGPANELWYCYCNKRSDKKPECENRNNVRTQEDRERNKDRSDRNGYQKYSGNESDVDGKTHLRSSLPAGDIVFEVLYNISLLFYDEPHDITNGNNTHNIVILQHWQVTNVLVCHQLHALFNS